jgi:hypothetical protein
LVTANSVASKRHVGLKPGKIAVLSWPGQPTDPINQYQGVKWIDVSNWIPFQKKSFVTPAFPGYISGHSTFSRSAAEVLTALTGSPFFPGGLGSYTVNSLAFEKGPTRPVVLQYATYYDAADLAGLSRIWGGIHPPVDNLVGRKVGSQVGKTAWATASKYFDGSVLSTPSAIAIHRKPSGTEVRFETHRGLYYKLQSTTDLNQPFADEAGDAGTLVRAEDSSIVNVIDTTGGVKFFKPARQVTP